MGRGEALTRRRVGGLSIALRASAAAMLRGGAIPGLMWRRLSLSLTRHYESWVVVSRTRARAPRGVRLAPWEGLWAEPEAPGTRAIQERCDSDSVGVCAQAQRPSGLQGRRVSLAVRALKRSWFGGAHARTKEGGWHLDT